MAIKIEGEEQDLIAQDEDEGRTDGGSPSLLTQPAATQQEPTPPSRSMTGNARPIPYLDTYGNRTDTDPVPAPIQTGQAQAARTDISGFVRPLTPEENEKYQEQKRRRLEYGMPGVIEDIFRGNRQAWEHNPEERAQQLWLADRTGIPESMMGDPEVYREAQIRNQMMMDSILLQDAPERVIEWFNVPGALDVARDDIPTLTAMGRALDRLAVRNAPTQERTFGDAWREGMAVVAGGYADKRFMESSVEGNDLLWNEAWWMLPEEDKVRLREQRRKNLLEAEAWWRNLEKGFTPEAALRSGGFRGFAQDVVQGLPYTLKSMAVNAPLALMGPAGAATGAILSAADEAETEQARVFRERVARGEDPMTVYNDTFNSVFLPNVGLLAASNFLQNRLTFGPIARGGKGILANPWVRRAGELGLSSMFEGGEEIGQSLISSWSLGDDVNIADLLYEGAVGAGTGLFFSGGGAAINTVFGKYTQSRQAKQRVEAFQALSDATAASKLKERNPRLFRDFVERATTNGPVQEVGIPAERFAEYFQSQGIDPMQMAEDLGVGNQYSEATLAGTDLTIPIATFTEKLAGSEHFAGLQEDLRIGENAMTAREAREFDQNMVQEFDQAIREASETETEYQANLQAVEAIRDDLKAQIIALNHKALGSKQAETTAALYTAWLVNEARLKKISPRELADLVNLRAEYDKNTGDPIIRRTMKNAAQEWFNQPLGPNVDPKARVTIVPVTRTLPNLPTWLRKKQFPADVREQVLRDFSGGITNRHTGMTLTLSNLGLDHILNTARNDTAIGGEVLYNSIPLLKNLAQEAYLIDPQKDIKPPETIVPGQSGNLETVHRFVVPVEIDGRQHSLMLTAKEYEPGKAVIDGAKLYDMKHLKEVPGRPSQSGPAYAREGVEDTSGSLPRDLPLEEGSLAGPSATPGTLSVRELIEGVKDAYGENYLQSAAPVPDIKTETVVNPDTGETEEWIFRDSESGHTAEVSKAMNDPNSYFVVLRGNFDFNRADPIKSYPTPEQAQQAARQALNEFASRHEMPENTRLQDRYDLVKKLRNTSEWSETDTNRFEDIMNNMDDSNPATWGLSPEETKAMQDLQRETLMIDDEPDSWPGDLRTEGLRLQKILWGDMDAESYGLTEEQAEARFDELAADIEKRRSKAEKQFDKESAKAEKNLEQMFEAHEVIEDVDEAEQSRETVPAEILQMAQKRLQITGNDRRLAVRQLESRIKSDEQVLSKLPEARKAEFENELNKLRDVLGVLKSPETYNQKDQRAARGYSRFLDGETVIGILKNGDRSTFLHEMAHLFLESRRRFSLETDVPEMVRRDWAKITDWLGVSDLDFSQSFSIADIDFSKPLSDVDKKRVEDHRRWTNAQEKWASGFEKYLMEGEAPTPELQRAFRNFKKWLTDIYKAVKNIVYTDADGQQQAFEINDEIRGVMDRMLASEEEIEASRTLREARDIAETLKARGIPDDISARYKDLIEQGADRAKAKLYRKLVSELRDEKRVELRELKKEARRQAGREVWEQPEYKALKALRMPPEKGGLRLSMPDLIEQMGTAEAEALVRELPFGVVANTGIDIDMAADLLGYPSGDALIEDLKKAKETPPAKAISDRVRTEMEQRESLAGDPKALQREVEEALHGSERLEWMALEEQLLKEEAEKVGESIGEEQQKEQREQGRREEREANEQARRDATRDWRQWADDMAARTAAYEETAKKIIAGKTLSEATRTGFYMAAERRAADKAYRAAMDGKSWLAADWKQREMLNHALAAESLRIKQEIETGERLLKKYWPNRKKLLGVIGQEHFAQIMGLLERTGFNREDPGSAGRSRLTDWIRKIGAEKQIDLPIAQWIQDLDVRDTRMSPSSLSVDAFRDVVDAVKMIDYVGRNEGKLLASEKQADFQAAVNSITEAIRSEYGEPGAPMQNPDSKPRSLAGQYFGSLDRIETIIRMADNLKNQGTVWESLYLPAQRASDKQIVMGEKAKAEYQGLLNRLAERMGGKKELQKFLTTRLDTGLIDTGTGTKLYWTGEQLLAAMLNWGNEMNRERLVFGWGMHGLGMDARFADDAQYYTAFKTGESITKNILDRMSSPEMWDFAQGVWDMFDSYWPQVEQLEKTMTGVTPEKIEAAPIRTPEGKVLRGGYYPVSFDTGRDWMGFKHQEKEQVNALNKAQATRAMTKHGHTKQRVERLVGHPIRLDLGVIQEHLSEVIHDLAFRPVVRDLEKLTTNDQVRAMLTHAVGREAYMQFSGWIKDLANQTKPKGAAAKAVTKAIGRAATVQLGLKLTTALGNFSSLTVAAWRLGPLDTVRSLVGFYMTPWNWSQASSFALSSSPELRDRINGADSGIRAAYDAAKAGVTDTARKQAERSFYQALGYSEYMISIPIWSAAYDQGLRMYNADHQKAVDHADWVVRSTQNTSSLKDKAAIQRDGTIGAVLTLYYSQMGSKYNLFREEMHRLKHGAKLPGTIRMTAFLLTVITLETALNELLKGKGPDEPEKDQTAKWLLDGSLGNFANMFPLFGTAVNSGLAWGGRNYRVSPAFAGFESLARTTGYLKQDLENFLSGNEDKLHLWRDTESTAETVGYAIGLPTQQLFQWGQVFMRWMENEPDFTWGELIWPKRGK